MGDPITWQVGENENKVDSYMAHKPDSDSAGASGFWHSRYAVGLMVMGAVAGYFLVMEHLAHVVDALPYVLLLACPLMHLFMHHGHGDHGHRHDHKDQDDQPDPPDKGERS